MILSSEKEKIAMLFGSHYITCIHQSEKTRPIQLILTNYKYPHQITDSFDQPYLGAYFDGETIYLNHETRLSLYTSLIDIDVDRLMMKRLYSYIRNQ